MPAQNAGKIESEAVNSVAYGPIAETFKDQQADNWVVTV